MMVTLAEGIPEDGVCQHPEDLHTLTIQYSPSGQHSTLKDHGWAEHLLNVQDGPMDFKLTEYEMLAGMASGVTLQVTFREPPRG